MTDAPAVSLDRAVRLVATIERRRLPLAALFAANVASLLGRQIATVAIPCAVFAATSSVPHAVLVATGLLFPWLLTDPAGNAWFNRIGPKGTSVAAGILGATTVAMMPLFDLPAMLPLSSLLLIAVPFAYITALGSVARHAMLPETADLAGCSVEWAGRAMNVIARAALAAGPLLAILGIVRIGVGQTTAVAAIAIAIAAAADTRLVAPTGPDLARGRQCLSTLSATSAERAGGILDRT